MSVSLYDLSVASYLQTLTAISGCLEKGLAHCTAQGPAPHHLLPLPTTFRVWVLSSSVTV